MTDSKSNLTSSFRCTFSGDLNAIIYYYHNFFMFFYDLAIRLLINILTSSLVFVIFLTVPLLCLLVFFTVPFLCERRFLIRLPDFSITLSAAFFPSHSPA